MHKKQGMNVIDRRPTAKAGSDSGADALHLLDSLLSQAKRAGAEAADAVLAERDGVSVAWRLGQQESLERSQAKVVGLRVFIGRRQAMVSSSDVSDQALAQLVERGVAMAKVVPEDPFCGLADPEQLGGESVDVDSFDPEEIDASRVTERAAATEAAALAVAGVTNSEGAESGSGRDRYAIAATNGFCRSYQRSWHSLSVSVLAGTGTTMERDYDYTGTVYVADLDDPQELGRRCGERAVRRLNPRKAATAQVPVIFEPRVARSLLSHLASAINGSAVARGTTFLVDRLGQPLFAPQINVIDDPLRPRGLRSRPFDGEGIAAARRSVIEDGVLTTWLLDLASARQLGLPTTGHASRGTASPPSPSPSNLYLEAGTSSVADLMGDIGSGLYVTDLMGFGVNGVTGDYSRGASGFWIENGELAYPVSEITVSGSLAEMYRGLTPADDLVFRYGTDSPTVRVDGLTVAGR